MIRLLLILFALILVTTNSFGGQYLENLQIKDVVITATPEDGYARYGVVADRPIYTDDSNTSYDLLLGGSSELDDLDDVTYVGTPSNAQVLEYSTASSSWYNKTPSYLEDGVLDDIGDVVITTATTNEVLTFNGSNWINAPPSSDTLALNDLTDVIITGSPSAKNILEFDGSTFVNATPSYVSEVLGTRVIDGGILSINGGNSALLDISAVEGKIVDSYTDPLNPVETNVSCSASAGITLTNLATSPTTFILVDSSCNILQQATIQTNEQFRDYLVLGTVVHPNNTNITAVNNLNLLVNYDVSASLSDLARAIGPVNTGGGNVFAANGANLKIDKTNGIIFEFGSNRTNHKDPNNVTIAPCTACNFGYTWRNALGNWTSGPIVTDIVANLYDDGTGTDLAPNGTVPSNRWTIQRVFINAGGNILIQPGQAVYRSSDLARNAVNTEDWELSTIAETLLYIGNIITRGGSTDLSADAIFLKVITAGSGSTQVEQNNWAIVDIDHTTNPNNIVGCNVVYAIDASGGTVNVTLPDSSTANDGCQNRFILEANTNPVNITTTGGTQLIGELTTQVIDQEGKGFSVISHGVHTVYLIAQDSRFLEGSTDSAIQSWNDTTGKWQEVPTITATNGTLTITGTLGLNSQFFTSTATGEADNDTIATKGYVDDNGGGSGVGDSEIFASIDFEDNDITGWDTTNLTNASFVTNTASPLNGVYDGKFANVTSSGSEYVCTPWQTVPEGSKNSFQGYEFKYAYDGDDDDILAWMETKSINALAVTVTATIDSVALEAGDSKRGLITGFPLTDSTEARACYQITTVNNGKFLYIDDLEFKANPLNKTKILDTQNYSISQPTSSLTNTADEIEWNQATATITASGALLMTAVDDSGNTRTEFTANRDIKSISVFANSAVSAGYTLGLYLNSGTTAISIGTQVGGSYSVALSWSGALKKDDYLTIARANGDGTKNGSVTSIGALSIFGFTAIAESEGVVHSGTFPENVYSARIANNGTATITSQNSDAIASVSRTAAGIVAYTFKSGAFTQIPSISAQLVKGPASAAGNATVHSQSTSGFTVTTVDSAGALADIDVDIVLQRQGTDYKPLTGTIITPTTQTCYLKDVKSNGTNGGTFTAGGWYQRDLTVLNNDGGILNTGCSFATLSSNRFTLGEGVYLIEASAPATSGNGTIDSHVIKLIKDASGTPIDLIIGANSQTNVSTGNAQTRSQLEGTITISQSYDFEISHYCGTTQATYGFGLATSAGVSEIYTTVKITKIK